LEACPELETPAAPYVLTLPAVRVQPSARITASASATGSISELNLRGLLPCCVRFAPTGHPVNGNTCYRPAGSLWPGGTRTRWIPLRGFTGSFQLLLFQAFPTRYGGELEVRPPRAPTTGRPRRLSKSSGTHCSGPDQEEKHTENGKVRRGESGPDQAKTSRSLRAVSDTEPLHTLHRRATRSARRAFVQSIRSASAG